MGESAFFSQLLAFVALMGSEPLEGNGFLSFIGDHIQAILLIISAQLK